MKRAVKLFLSDRIALYRVWKPSSSVDDTTLRELSGESTFLGIKKKVQNLSDLKTGDLYTWAELEAAGLTATCRVIPCRRVTVDKGGGFTRARIVIKDTRTGDWRKCPDPRYIKPDSVVVRPSVADRFSWLVGTYIGWCRCICSLYGDTVEAKKRGGKAAHFFDKCKV